MAALATIAIAALTVSACHPDGSSASGADGPSQGDVAPYLSSTTSDPPTTSTSLPPTPTVMVVGDSTMADVAPALVAAMESTGAIAVDRTTPGVGIVRVGMHGAPSTLTETWTQFVAEDRPDLTVVMLGAWDMPFIESEGTAAYIEPVRSAMQALTSLGGQVLWLAMPTHGERTSWAVDDVTRDVALQLNGVTWIDLDLATVAPEGGHPASYIDQQGAVVHLRKSDAFHYCPDGAERTAAAVVEAALELRAVASPRPGWEQGTWRTSNRYDDPSCR